LRDRSILHVAVVVALVVSGIDLLNAAVFAVMDSAGWRGFDLGWRFWVEPVVRSAIVFLVLLALSALVLRKTRGRYQPVPDDA
jgi:hypothetical protein